MKSALDTLDMEMGEILYHQRPKYIEWKIRDFGSVFKKRQHITSPTFPFDGAEWYLRFCTYSVFHDSSFKVFLIRDSAHEPGIFFSVRIGIKRDDGTVYVSDTCDKHDFKPENNCAWVSRLEKRSRLRADMSKIAPQDEVTFFCWMSIIEGCREVETQTEAEGVEKLVLDFKALLLSGEETDVTLKVKDRDYKVHRAVLAARSTVFSAMMKSDMKEKSSGVVQIDDCDPVAFQQFLTYLYSGDLVNFSADTVFALHTIADKYDAQELKKRCVQFIMENLSVEIFCDCLSLSLRYDESELLEKAVEFFAKNLTNILVTPKWLFFVKENPVVANELHIKSAKFYAKLV